MRSIADKSRTKYYNCFIIQNRADHYGILIGVMLEIGILYDDNISRCLLDAIKAAPFPLFLSW